MHIITVITLLLSKISKKNMTARQNIEHKSFTEIEDKRDAYKAKHKVRAKNEDPLSCLRRTSGKFTKC